jgi:diguanylate cyclase (GGDEF)-like protein/PAS domain S-box-containing protein
MNDQAKTNAELIEEISCLNQRIRELEQSETERKKIEGALRESKERLNALYQESPIPTFTWQKRGDDFFLADFNRAAVRITDGKAHNFLGKRAEELYQYQPQILEDMRLCFTEHSAIRRDILSKHFAPGKSLSVHYAFIPPDLIIVHTENQTDRKLAEAALENERNLLRNLIDNVPDRIYAKDSEGRFIICNEAMIRRMGKTSMTELVGKSDFDLLPAEMAQRFHADEQAIIQSGIPMINREEPLMTEGGKITRWNLATKVPLLDKEGNRIGIVGVGREITDRKRIEEALRESQAFYHSLVEQLPAGIFRKDHEGRYVFVSPWFCRLKGRKEEEFLGKTPQEVAASEAAKPDTTEQAIKYAAGGADHHVRIMQTGKPLELVEEYTDAAGGKQFVHVIKIPVFDSEGKVIGTQGILFDITERKRTEQEIETLADIGRIISSTPEIDEVYERFAEAVRKIVPFDRIVINIIDVKMNSVTNVYMAGHGVSDRNIGVSYLLKGSGNFEMVRTKSSLLIQTEDFDEYMDRFPMLLSTFQAGFRSIMNIPFISKGEIVGGLLLRSFKPYAYTDRDVRLAERVGNQIAGTIANAQLFTGLKKAEQELKESEQRYRELSIVDDLTQLYNSRHFYFQLKIELDRSNRYEQPLTLLLFDLDNFKTFNDAYGHVEGDQVLKRLGQVVKRCLRETDFAFRYGGEEFTILLPMTTSADGAVTAERIRTEFKKETFSPAPGQDVHATVSIGLAQYKPQEEMKAFVHRVDQLMYQGKKNGKDRVCSDS